MGGVSLGEVAFGGGGLLRGVLLKWYRLRGVPIRRL